MHLILLGAPGAGKGTQGSLLAEKLGIPKIATGDILRQAVREGTPLGQEAKRFMDAGELVPDTVIFGLVREALAAPEAREGAIFDGFPRNVAQAQELAGILADQGRKLDAVVALEVPAESIVERMSGRRTDPETGEVYHLVHNPPPAEVAARCTQRPDDRAETIRHRLEVYEASTAPLVRWYEDSGVPLLRVNGDRPIEEVQSDILSRLKDAKK
ncbi:MAG TPA: adenylate kinase [Longimicrobiaceae bacterium]|nr:adenylate kinase [Longimicrobiaceae bacterium]